MDDRDDTHDVELRNTRLDYAWRYFESAARQRMLFFNYFLIAVGILASAIGFAWKEQLYPIAVFAGVFGFLASAASIAFDIRMLAFVERALRVLDFLERRWLFPDGLLASYPKEEKTRQLGLARIEPDARAAGTVSRHTGHKATKVKWWIRSVECLAAAGFLVAVVVGLIAWAGPVTKESVPPPSATVTQPATQTTQTTAPSDGSSTQPSPPGVLHSP